MVIAIHQPNFLPWLGYFYKIAKSDYFVFLDDVQYTKNSFINRNKIKYRDKEKWLTCPVVYSGQFGNSINNMLYFQPEKSFKTITGTLKEAYRHTPFFNYFYSIIENNLNLIDRNLADQNIVLIKAIMNELGIKTPTIRSSDLGNIQGTSTARLVSICKYLNGDSYFCGFGAAKYQDDELFIGEGIKPLYSDFVSPVYPQLGESFISRLSIIDALFNIGHKTADYLL